MRGRREGQRVGPYDTRRGRWVGGRWRNFDVDDRAFPYAERMAARLTIDDLAALARVSRRTIIRMEQGKRPTSRGSMGARSAITMRQRSERQVREALAKSDSRRQESPLAIVNSDKHVEVTVQRPRPKSDKRRYRQKAPKK